MTNIIDFTKRKNTKRMFEEGQQFLHCQNCNPTGDEEYSGFAPIVLFDNKGPMIVGLVCNGCEEVMNLNHGRI